MNQVMEGYTEQFLFMLIAQHLQTGSVDKGTAPLIVKTEDPLGRGVKQQADMGLALLNLHLLFLTGGNLTKK